MKKRSRLAILRSPDARLRRRLPRGGPKPTRRFVVLTVAFLLLFSAASPLYLESPSVFALAGFVARAAAAILGGVGVSAHAAANVLWTPRGGFLVTQECISTPLIPVYLAAICTYSTTWRRLILGVLATLPLFIALGIVRLLVVALPDAWWPRRYSSCTRSINCSSARWSCSSPRCGATAAERRFGHALVGVIVGVAFVHLARPVLHAPRHISGRRAARRSAGSDRAPPRVPGRPLSRAVGRGLRRRGWRRFLAGLAVLGLTQTAGLLALHALASHSGLTAHVRDVRGWAVAGPVLIFAAAVNVARARR